MVFVHICYIYYIYIHPLSKRFSYREIYRLIYTFVFLHVGETKEKKQKVYIFLKCQPFCKLVYIRVYVYIADVPQSIE